jgi:hypothetical protein
MSEPNFEEVAASMFRNIDPGKEVVTVARSASIIFIAETLRQAYSRGVAAGRGQEQDRCARLARDKAEKFYKERYKGPGCDTRELRLSESVARDIHYALMCTPNATTPPVTTESGAETPRDTRLDVPKHGRRRRIGPEQPAPAPAVPTPDVAFVEHLANIGDPKRDENGDYIVTVRAGATLPPGMPKGGRVVYTPTPLTQAQIAQWDDEYGDDYPHVRALAAEVRRLRGQLDDALAEADRRSADSLREADAARAEVERLRDLVEHQRIEKRGVRAEHNETRAALGRAVEILKLATADNTADNYGGCRLYSEAYAFLASHAKGGGNG